MRFARARKRNWISLPVVAAGETSLGSITRFCGHCGQCLVLPTNDLARSFRCPRCHSVHVAGALVDPSTPIAAVPASDRMASLPAEMLPEAAPAAGGAQALAPHLHVAQSPNIMRKLVGSAALAVSSADRLVTLADRVDSFLYGKRLRLLVVAAAGVVTTAEFASGDLAWLQQLTVFLFIVLGVVLALARVAMFRDDEGRWSAAVGWSNVGFAFAELGDIVGRLRTATPSQRLQAAGSGLLGIALITLALRVLFDRIYSTGLDSWDFDWSARWDYCALLAGLGLWFWGARARRRDGERSALIADPSKDQVRVSQVALAFAELPAVVDCRQGSAHDASESMHPLLGELFAALRSWHPRRAEKEKPYQYSLYRRLRERIPKAEPQLEVPLRSQGVPYFGKIDILLGHCVLIEMKLRLTTSTAQKAAGQIGMYVRLWEGKGPLVLVLCETKFEFAVSFFEPEIKRLRASGHSVVAVTV